MPTHHQVPFKTATGKNVTVDEGMLDVLTTMRKLGIKTQYSCQQNIAHAYVCSSSSGHLRIVCRAFFLYFTKRYSPESRQVFRSFLRSRKSWTIGHYSKNGQIENFTHKVVINDHLLDVQYKYEWSASLMYGVRTTLRWPSSDIKKVNAFLLETLDNH